YEPVQNNEEFVKMLPIPFIGGKQIFQFNPWFNSYDLTCGFVVYNVLVSPIIDNSGTIQILTGEIRLCEEKIIFPHDGTYGIKDDYHLIRMIDAGQITQKFASDVVS